MAPNASVVFPVYKLKLFAILFFVPLLKNNFVLICFETNNITRIFLAQSKFFFAREKNSLKIEEIKWQLNKNSIWPVIPCHALENIRIQKKLAGKYSFSILA